MQNPSTNNSRKPLPALWLKEKCVDLVPETHRGSHVKRDTTWGNSAGKDTKDLSSLPYSPPVL